VTTTDWPRAWHWALYGPDGFYRRPGPGGAPAAHFRTAVHAAPAALAEALTELAVRERASAIVDIGAGRGELVSAMAARAAGPAASPDEPALRLHAVDLVPRPAGLPAGIGWSPGLDQLPDDALDGALVIAWELLDTAPVAVLELDDAGRARQVLVETHTGEEELGPPADEEQLAWCERWWPLTGAPAGSRAEVGITRDALWGNVIERASSANAVAALAVDYGHDRRSRPPTGSLTGYRAGRVVPAVPDGGCDITAHVALDAVAEAGLRCGATGSRLTSQREALQQLGTTAGTGADTGQWTAKTLAERGARAELLDPGGLGGFGWLLQQVR